LVIQTSFTNGFQVACIRYRLPRADYVFSKTRIFKRIRKSGRLPGSGFCSVSVEYG